MNKNDRQHFETLAVHAGHAPEDSGGLTPAMHPSTTFLRDAEGNYPGGIVYGRYGNPTRARLEAALAELENAREAIAFASGMAAVQAVFQMLKPGEHVIVSRDAYHGVTRLIERHLVPHGIAVDFADTRKPEYFEHLRRPETRLVWLESPSNPLLRITDLAAVAAWAREHEIITACDSTLATPMLQKPLELGIDLVVHSATKYLGGHSDLLGGVVCANSLALADAVRHWQHDAGAMLPAFDAWLLLRSLPTLPVRLKQQCASAQRVAEWLAAQSTVEQVFYPGLASHEDHVLAREQMNAFGGLLSFTYRGDETAARRIASSTRIFTQATSLGSIESLIEHRASVEGTQRRSPENLLRLAIGLEHADDLIADLAQALNPDT